MGFEDVDGIIGSVVPLHILLHMPLTSARILALDLRTSHAVPNVRPVASVACLISSPGTLIPDVTQCIPTVTDNAFAQGLIDAHEIGISFEPTTSVNNQNGELTFGGVDTSKFTGPLNFV